MKAVYLILTSFLVYRQFISTIYAAPFFLDNTVQTLRSCSLRNIFISFVTLRRSHHIFVSEKEIFWCELSQIYGASDVCIAQNPHEDGVQKFYPTVVQFCLNKSLHKKAIVKLKKSRNFVII